jgi:hypothetical protein
MTQVIEDPVQVGIDLLVQVRKMRATVMILRIRKIEMLIFLILCPTDVRAGASFPPIDI